MPSVKNLSLIVFISGIMSVLLIIIMMLSAGGNPKPAQYPNKLNFDTAIMWFELTADKSELADLLGDPKSNEGILLREKLDAINRIDYVYILLYPVFTVSLILLISQLIRRKRNFLISEKSMLVLSVLLLITIILGDSIENYFLLKLTTPDITNLSNNLIFMLNVFTRIKWSGIALSAFILGTLYIQYFTSPLKKIFGAMFILNGLLTTAGVVMISQRSLIEKGGSIIGILTIISIIQAFMIYRSE